MAQITDDELVMMEEAVREEELRPATDTDTAVLLPPAGALLHSVGYLVGQLGSRLNPARTRPTQVPRKAGTATAKVVERRSFRFRTRHLPVS
jgi:hypothetical protein